MVELPPLLLTANVSSVFKICAQLEDSGDPVVCDASHLMVAEPMALCALVATLSRMQRLGRNIRVTGLSPQFRQQLESLDLLSKSLHLGESERSSGYQGTLHAYRVKSEREGNEIGNKIANSIAALIPPSHVIASAQDAPPRSDAIVYPLRISSRSS